MEIEKYFKNKPDWAVETMKEAADILMLSEDIEDRRKWEKISELYDSFFEDDPYITLFNEEERAALFKYRMVTIDLNVTLWGSAETLIRHMRYYINVNPEMNKYILNKENDLIKKYQGIKSRFTDFIILTSLLIDAPLIDTINNIKANWILYGITETETLTNKIAYTFYTNCSDYQETVEDTRKINSFQDIINIVKEYEELENNKSFSEYSYQSQLFYGRYAEALEEENEGYKFLVPKNIDEYKMYYNLYPRSKTYFEYYDTIFLLNSCDIPVGRFCIVYDKTKNKYIPFVDFAYYNLNKTEKILVDNYKSKIANIFKN